MRVSLKALADNFGDAAATVLLPVLRGDYDEYELRERFPVADRRWRECFHPPTYEDMALHVANDILDMHGIEGWVDQPDCSNTTGISYCNAGDPWVPTVLVNRAGVLVIGCQGNYVR